MVLKGKLKDKADVFLPSQEQISSGGRRNNWCNARTVSDGVATRICGVVKGDVWEDDEDNLDEREGSNLALVVIL